MDLGKEGKLALVTGSTAGIGLMSPRALAEEGARVTVNGRTRARVVQAVEQLKHELSRHYLPAMRERDWGRIVFVSSESAVQIPVEMIHYGMTKIAQIAIARGLAESLAGAALRVDGGVVRAIV